MVDKHEEGLRGTLTLKATRGRLPTKLATLILQTIQERPVMLWLHLRRVRQSRG